MSGDEELPQQRQSQEERRKPSQTPSPTPQAGQQQFVFVDGTAETGRSREAIRVHVMRESHRARRAGQGQPGPSTTRGDLQIWDSSSSSSSPSSQGPRTLRSSQRSLAASEPQGIAPDLLPGMIGPRRSPAERPAALEAKVELTATAPNAQVSAQPATLLENSRRDPFGQCPDQQLYHAETLMDGFANQLDNVYSELLPLYRNEEASLHALLAFAATQQGIQQGRYFLVASQAEASTLRILRDSLVQADGPQAPGTVLAVAIMAHIEERRGNSQASRIHWQAMKNMLQERGGVESLNDDRALQAQLLRLDATVCTTTDSSPSRPYITSQHGSLPLAVVPQPQQDISDQVLQDGTTRSEAQQIIDLGEEFLAFFCHIKTSLESSSQPPTFCVPDPIATVIKSTLSTAQSRLLDCTTTACLLYLAAAKLDHQRSQSPPENVLETLSHEMQQRKSHHAVHAEELLYIMFLSDSGHQRARLVSRLMSIAKKLFSGSWQLSRQVLSAYIGVPSDGNDSAFDSQYAAQWDTDSIRREINGGLYPLLGSLREGTEVGQ